MVICSLAKLHVKYNENVYKYRFVNSDLRKTVYVKINMLSNVYSKAPRTLTSKLK